MGRYHSAEPLPQQAVAAEPHSPVWITGIGMVTPLGIGWPETWRAMCEGRSGIRAPRSFDTTELDSKAVGEVPQHFEEHYREACRLRFPERYARFTRFALLSAQQALENSGIELEHEERSRIGVSIGVGAGCFNYLMPVDRALQKKGEGLWPALDHNYVIKYMHNAASAQVSIWLGLEGPSTTVSAACATGGEAIATAIDWIRSGRADVVLAGSCDATVNPFVIHAYNQIFALSRHHGEPAGASRPFDLRRDGFVMAEGGAVLLLESEAHARQRGARRYASLLGHGISSEAYNIVAPRPEGQGMAKTMKLALADAGLSPSAIDYISAHGTGTKLNDANETAAIKAVFGERAYQLPVSSQKSMIGHAIGATSAIEAGITALTLHHGILTPTINYQQPDPACDLDYVPNQARRAEVRYALSNSFGFGGHNCCLVFGQ